MRPHYVDVSKIALNSVDENANDNDFVVYPNPTKNEVRILTDFKYSSVSVFSLDGTQLIYSVKQDVLDISTLTNGIYIIKIKNKESNKSLIQKIIVSKTD